MGLSTTCANHAQAQFPRDEPGKTPFEERVLSFVERLSPRANYPIVDGPQKEFAGGANQPDRFREVPAIREALHGSREFRSDSRR